MITVWLATITTVLGTAASLSPDNIQKEFKFIKSIVFVELLDLLKRSTC